MNVLDWLAEGKADAVRRGLPALAPILEGLAKATTVLREADWNEAADEPARDNGGPVDER